MKIQISCFYKECYHSLPDASFVEVEKLEPQVFNFPWKNQTITADLIDNKNKNIYDILEITKLGK